MSRRTAILVLLAVAGLGCTGVAVWLTLGSDHEQMPVVNAVLGPLIGLSFGAVGLAEAARNRGNRIGPLMAGVGFAWFLASLAEANDPVVFTIGCASGSLFLGVLAHMLLAFPSGRLERPAQRFTVVFGYLVVTVGVVVMMLFSASDDDRPRNVMLVADEPAVGDVLLAVVRGAGVALAAAVLALLIQRFRAAGPTQRRTLAPVLGTGALMIAFVGIQLAGDALHGSGTFRDAISIVIYACFLAVPYAFLGGRVRGRLSRAGAVGALVRDLAAVDGRGDLRQAVAAALGDPTLELVYRRRRGDWVDAQGARYALPAGDPARAVTTVDRDGEVIAALVHDAALCEERPLLHATAAAVALALDNERLAAELRARVAELKESRENIIEFGLRERRRLERDLHDGAQQRLISLSLQVSMARTRLEDDPATAGALLDRARDELRQTIDELRELARGIHPAILADRGLAAALEVLAGRSPVPVAVSPLPPERLPVPVEAVAYFVVSESLANIAKYAAASRAEVRVERRNGHALVEVADDGVGGADPLVGTGLRGLADRVAALDGELEIHSPPGAGTRVRAAIPCVSS